MRNALLVLATLVVACDGSGTPADADVDRPVAVDTSTTDVVVAPDDVRADIVLVDAAPVDVALVDATPADASPSDAAHADVTNACVMGGGACVPAMRNSSPPGFSLTCPAGTVTVDGRPTWLGPGTDLIFGGRLTNGCPSGGGSFEAVLYGCCIPSDAGR